MAGFGGAGEAAGSANPIDPGGMGMGAAEGAIALALQCLLILL